MSRAEKRGLLFILLAISALQGEPVSIGGIPFAILYLIGVIMFLRADNGKKDGPP
jgi:drug/metabolite transporter (DMT)-like permease